MTTLHERQLEEFARRALAEDVGRGDVTTAATILEDTPATGTIVFRDAAVVCGLPVAATIFRALDSGAQFHVLAQEGARVAQGAPVATVACGAQALLTGERVSLNVIARLAATATLTRRYVDAIVGTRARILDTRKTTPGMRFLEKYAVRTGGAHNHRHGLDDGILIKDNHIRVAGSIAAAVARARDFAPPGLAIEVEVDTLDQLAEALHAGAEVILLDNMSPAEMTQAVHTVAGRARLEASGGVTLQTVRAIAETGVDFISVGALTHSAGSVDVSMEVP